MTSLPDDWRPLTLLAEAPVGSPTVFCVHGGGGDIAELRPLAEALNGSTRFYGIDSRGLDGIRTPFETFEEEAAYLLDYICAQDPGPYILAGYSGGGAIAYEIAQQLLRKSRQVELIMMFDALEPSAWSAPMTRLDRLKMVPRANLHFLLKILVDKLRYRDEEMPIKNQSQTAKERVYAAYLRGQERYVANPYAGRILLARARRADWHYIRAGNTLGWGRVATGKIEVCDIDCEHHDLMKSPAVTQLASVVRERLRRLALDSSSKKTAE